MNYHPGNSSLGEAWEKTALAIHACVLMGNHCLHRRTAVTLRWRWVSERLAMGHYSPVTQAVRRLAVFREAKDRAV
jgi:hypothetical protein